MFTSDDAVAWESKKQTVVAFSSMEADYVALCQGGKEIVFTRSLLGGISFEEFTKEPKSIYCDNQEANFMVKSSTVHKRGKHIGIKFHYIRDQYNDDTIDVHYVPSERNFSNP